VSLSGLVAALVVTAWMQPFGRAPSLGKAAAAAAVWLTATVLAGTLGILLAESFVEGRLARPGMAFLLGSAAAWVLLPPMLLCGQWGSGWAAAISACACAAAAASMWGRVARAGAESDEVREPWVGGPHFADLPAPDSGRPQAFAIAVCVELAVVLGNRGELFWATVLAGVAGFVLVWKRLSALHAPARDGLGSPAMRGGAAVVLALLILMPLLLLRRGGAHGGAETAEAAARTRAETARSGAGEQSGGGADAYRGIVLFTVQDKKKELPPLPMQRDLLRTGKAKPLVIAFAGSYWYFQAPQQGPGLHPHMAHGDPVAVNIYSTGWVPLAMQAHQTLARPVDLRSCGAMEVTVRNGDNRRGRIEMGVLLTDTTGPGKPSMYLGTQPLVSTEAEYFSFKARPVSEVVRFAIPARGGLRKFDGITVFFFPGMERETLGAKVGIEQFELEPR
jgi:hypothetical protein